MNIHSTRARAFAAVAAGIAAFGIAGCGTDAAPTEAPAQDIGVVAPGPGAGESYTSADTAERNGQRHDGWHPVAHKLPANHS